MSLTFDEQYKRYKKWFIIGAACTLWLFIALFSLSVATWMLFVFAVVFSVVWVGIDLYDCYLIIKNYKENLKDLKKQKETMATYESNKTSWTYGNAFSQANQNLANLQRLREKADSFLQKRVIKKLDKMSGWNKEEGQYERI